MEELKLDRSTKFLVVSIENISKSRLNQLEEWKQLDNPNKSSVDRLNRKIITEVNLNNDDEDNDESGRPSRANTQDTYKLYLEDVSTKKITQAYENEPLRFLRTENTGTPLPIKLGGRLTVLKGALIYNGVLLLTNKNCEYHGIHADDASYVSILNDGVIKKQIELLQL